MGDNATVLVFRHLLPLTEDDEALSAELRGNTRHSRLAAAGRARTARSRSIPAQSELYYELPEFGVRIALPPDRVHAGQPRHEPGAGVARGALLDPQPGERIADLFCGLGNFSLPLARARRAGDRLRGQQASWSSARAQNAAANGLVAQFEVRGPVQDRIRAFGPFAKLLIDPPREGAVELVKSLPDGLAAAHRLRLVRPGDAGARRRQCWCTRRASGWPRRAWSTCSRTPRTSKASRSSSGDRLHSAACCCSICARSARGGRCVGPQLAPRDRQPRMRRRRARARHAHPLSRAERAGRGAGQPADRRQGQAHPPQEPGVEGGQPAASRNGCPPAA